MLLPNKNCIECMFQKTKDPLIITWHTSPERSLLSQRLFANQKKCLMHTTHNSPSLDPPGRDCIVICFFPSTSPMRSYVRGETPLQLSDHKTKDDDLMFLLFFLDPIDRRLIKSVNLANPNPDFFPSPHFAGCFGFCVAWFAEPRAPNRPALSH